MISAVETWMLLTTKTIRVNKMKPGDFFQPCIKNGGDNGEPNEWKPDCWFV